jgi:uncharacterized membrane protein YczE
MAGVATLSILMRALSGLFSASAQARGYSHPVHFDPGLWAFLSGLSFLALAWVVWHLGKASWQGFRDGLTKGEGLAFGSSAVTIGIIVAIVVVAFLLGPLLGLIALVGGCILVFVLLSKINENRR